MLAYLAVRLLPRAWQLPAMCCAGALIFTTGWSRVVLHVHYVSDVLAGWVLAAPGWCHRAHHGQHGALAGARRPGAAVRRRASGRSGNHRTQRLCSASRRRQGHAPSAVCRHLHLHLHGFQPSAIASPSSAPCRHRPPFQACRLPAMGEVTAAASTAASAGVAAAAPCPPAVAKPCSSTGRQAQLHAAAIDLDGGAQQAGVLPRARPAYRSSQWRGRSRISIQRVCT